MRLRELVFGSNNFRFEKLPERLKDSTQYDIKEPKQYVQFGKLREKVISSKICPEQITETTLRFAFEVIERIIIDFWNELIIAHSPEYEFEVDQYIDNYLQKFKIHTTNRNSDEG